MNVNTDAALKMTENNLDQKSFNESNAPNLWTKLGADEIRRRQLRNLKSESIQTETQSLAQICAQISSKLALQLILISIGLFSLAVLFLWRMYLSQYVHVQNEKFENLESKLLENADKYQSKMTECQNQNDYLRRSYDVSDLLLKEKFNEVEDMKLQIHEYRNDYLQYAKFVGLLFLCLIFLLLKFSRGHDPKPGRMPVGSQGHQFKEKVKAINSKKIF